MLNACVDACLVVLLLLLLLLLLPPLLLVFVFFPTGWMPPFGDTYGARQDASLLVICCRT